MIYEWETYEIVEMGQEPTNLELSIDEVFGDADSASLMIAVYKDDRSGAHLIERVYEMSPDVWYWFPDLRRSDFEGAA